MDTEPQIIIPVDTDRPTEQNAKIVYAIPAKPKPKEPWWHGCLLWILVIFSCIGPVMICGNL